jgi:hypothetical protein
LRSGSAIRDDPDIEAFVQFNVGLVHIMHVADFLVPEPVRARMPHRYDSLDVHVRARDQHVDSLVAAAPPFGAE